MYGVMLTPTSNNYSHLSRFGGATQRRRNISTMSTEKSWTAPAMCQVALDRAARMAERFSLPGSFRDMAKYGG